MVSNPMYFAYGSNLNEADLRKWCEAEGLPFPLGPKFANAYLADTQLVFNYPSERKKGGALNIRHRLGQAAPGVLFHMATNDWNILDIRQGAPNVHKRLDIIALTEDGQEHVALTYQVDTEFISGTFVPPHPSYLQAIREGYTFHGLDDCMLNAVCEGKEPPWCLDKLFVYGTLMEGESRHHILESWGDHVSRRMVKARGILYNSGKGFPCMFPTERDEQIVLGELYSLKDLKKAFEILDIVEMVKRYGSTGSLFRRAIIRVEGTDGIQYPAWGYLYDGTPEGMTLIESGDWRATKKA